MSSLALAKLARSLTPRSPVRSESRDERAIEQFAWIPASMLENIKFVADPSMV